MGKVSNLVPEGWSVKGIADLVTLQYGKSPREIFNENGPYPVIGTGGVTGATSSYLHEGGTTVIGRKGTINKPSYIKGRFWAIDTTYYGENYQDVDPKWFYYNISSFDLMRYNEASGVPSLNRDTLYAIQLLKPPLPEQQKIATILSSVDDVIGKTRAQIDKLKDLKTGMMQELLTKGIGHTEFKDSSVGRIPITWDVKCLPEVAIYQNGKAFPSSDYLDTSSDGYYLIKPVNLDSDGSVNWSYNSTVKLAPKYWEQAQKYQVGSNEIVMNLTAQSLEDNFLGRVCMTKKNDKFLLNQRIARVTAKTELVLQRYLFWSLKGPFFRAHVEKITQGSKVQHLYNSNLDDALIAYPVCLLEQERIFSTLDSYEYAIYCKNKMLMKAQQIKKALMQDLLTGKVRVKLNESATIENA